MERTLLIDVEDSMGVDLTNVLIAITPRSGGIPHKIRRHE